LKAPRIGFKHRLSRFDAAVGLATPSSSSPVRNGPKGTSLGGSREGGRKVRRTKEGRQRCQRLGGFGHRGKRTPTQVNASREARFTLKFVSGHPIRRSGLGRRENAWSSDNAMQSLNLCGAPTRRKSWQRVGNTRGAGSRLIRMGGRSRLDASRVFCTGRSQGLVVSTEGASQKEVRSSH
jgi:hypothetical protein